MIKDEAYYLALDKRTNEYKEWKKTQTDLQPHEPKIEMVGDAEIVGILFTDKPQKGMEFMSFDEPKPSEGLGDTLEKVFKATKIDRLVKFIAGEDCGCDERKKKLNELFQYRAKPLCLEEEEYIFLLEFFKSNPNQIKPSEQKIMQRIYERVFQLKMTEFCDGCVKTMVRKMKQVYEAY